MVEVLDRWTVDDSDSVIRQKIDAYKILMDPNVKMAYNRAVSK